MCCRWYGILLSQNRQRSGSNCLTNTAHLLIGQSDAALCGQLGIFLSQDLVGNTQDGVAALAGHDTAHQHDVVHIVELGVQNGLN